MNVEVELISLFWNSRERDIQNRGDPDKRAGVLPPETSLVIINGARPDNIFAKRGAVWARRGDPDKRAGVSPPETSLVIINGARPDNIFAKRGAQRVSGAHWAPDGDGGNLFFVISQRLRGFSWI